MTVEVKYTESCNIYCTSEMNTWLKAQAAKLDITRTQLIRDIIQEVIDRSDDAPAKRRRIYGTGFD